MRHRTTSGLRFTTTVAIAITIVIVIVTRRD
jgi:hypothetical protein